jgi:choline dehydrogenase-like flavoprotein
MTGYFVPSRPAYDRGLHVIESFKRVGREQPAHSGFALSERLRREERLTGCVGYFIRRPFAETAPDYFAPGGKAVAHLLDVLRHNQVPDRRFGRRLADAVRDPGAAGRTLARHAGEIVRRNRCLALRTVLETTPRADSRVSLSDKRDRFGMPRVRVDWRIDRDDLRALSRLRGLLAETICRRELGTLVDDPACDADGWPNSMEGGKHHMGTTRMHADPMGGVVDPDCRVHGLANLYVAGSSVFPTSGYANPTLTIVALALRLADHLKAALADPRSRLPKPSP